ncbi:MAG: DUF1707 domain-containing protein [Actinophytocola sp.]|uniref:DUF1707 SHOCT-like domain-containing protein n=1 Tax=Actinophytocola sp. TaxID=1872138 RepID=UPI003C75D3A1
MSRVADAAIRISNVERDEAVSTLGAHLSTGRLALDEYEERCGKAVAARTRGDLEELFTDLPAPHPDLSSATPPAQPMREAGQLVSTKTGDAYRTVAGLTLFLGVPGVILFSDFHGDWWMYIVLGIVLVVTTTLSRRAKRAPRADT